MSENKIQRIAEIGMGKGPAKTRSFDPASPRLRLSRCPQKRSIANAIGKTRFSSARPEACPPKELASHLIAGMIRCSQPKLSGQEVSGPDFDKGPPPTAATAVFFFAVLSSSSVAAKERCQLSFFPPHETKSPRRAPAATTRLDWHSLRGESQPAARTWGRYPVHRNSQCHGGRPASQPATCLILSLSPVMFDEYIWLTSRMRRESSISHTHHITR